MHLSRRDKLVQVISRERAECSGLWQLTAAGDDLERNEGLGPSVYDRARIAGRLQAYQAQNAAWRDWFDAQGIDSVPVVYEDLA